MSAVSASPAPGVERRLDAVRALQHALYRAAKADPGRRFHALYDKVHRRDVLQRAWSQVRRNDGAPGIDQITLAEVEQYGVSRLLDELEAQLRAGTFRPIPARRVFIPKPGTQERRPLSIPAVRDRVVQAAVKIVLAPVFEADFLPCSFGFRPKRAAHDGLQVLVDESFAGARWVVETDVADCFGAIPHSGLMSAVQERISDRRLLSLLRAFLRAGVMEHGTVRRPVTGTAQGGVISPLMCNVYLHRLDRAWRGAYGTYVRYADDALVMCRSKGQAVAALARLTVLLAELGLRPKPAKTRIVQLTAGGQGVDFLGFHHRLVRSRSVPGRTRVIFLARWPSRKAMQHARDRIRFMTMRARLAAPVEQVVQEIHLFLRGVAGYFRYGNTAHTFDQIRRYALMRLALFIAKRHQRGRAWGFARLYRSGDDLGLISLNGIVVAPRPHRAWREKSNPAGEGRR
ncbi:group II intron reverse transcriptase/maturase [Mycobacterium sp.]|uniref:group II intron reverse transcriptase/maturase n=1 Tax=Mycobacterium sp. TaxID=1785 RepID=UPI003F95E2D2